MAMIIISHTRHYYNEQLFDIEWFTVCAYHYIIGLVLLNVQAATRT